MRSGDAADAEKGLRALAVPFFHHEFVRQAVVIALHNTPKQDAILSLLGGFAESGFLSTTQLVRVRAFGFTGTSQKTNKMRQTDMQMRYK